MLSGNNLYFHIDAFDIWDFIRDSVITHKEEKNIVPEIFDLVKYAHLATEQEPFLTAKAYEDGNRSDDYYERYRNNEKENDEFTPLDYFSVNGDFYDLNVECLIRRDDFHYIKFAKLFYLKLYTYVENEEVVDAFLRFHYFDNFYGDLREYLLFLETVVSEIIPLEQSEKAKYLIELWMYQVNPSKIPVPLLDGFLNERAISINESRNELKKIAEQSAVKENISNGESDNIKTDLSEYRIIQTNFSQDELLNFFSFLYKEKSENDLPFLSEENVREMFKNKLSIPPKHLRNKFTLNCTPRFPKKIIDYAIHRFYKLRFNKDDVNDKNSLIKFFASHLSDYARALENEDELNLVASNIKGEKSPKMKFKLENYIPDYIEPSKHRR